MAFNNAMPCIKIPTECITKTHGSTFKSSIVVNYILLYITPSYTCIHAKIWFHYNDVTVSKIASQITSITIVYSTVYSGPDQTKHQSSAWLAFVRRIHRGPVNSPHKWPVTRKMFPFYDVIIFLCFTHTHVMAVMALRDTTNIYIINSVTSRKHRTKYKWKSLQWNQTQ